MEDTEFDQALVASAFELIASNGWSRLSVAEAARAAGLPLDRVRTRYPDRLCVLLRFGRLADGRALDGSTLDGPPRDRLFDMIMRRIDALQAHRAGVLALFRDLPRDPVTALILGAATLRSMAWLLDAAGLQSHGLLGRLRAKGLTAVWLSTVHAWREDETEDLAHTMAALDRALTRAEQAENSVSGSRLSEK